MAGRDNKWYQSLPLEWHRSPVCDAKLVYYLHFYPETEHNQSETQRTIQGQNKGGGGGLRNRYISGMIY